MSLMDLIHQAMQPEPDPTAAQESATTLEDQMAMEALTDHVDFPNVEPVEIREVDALEALRAIESHMEITKPAETPYYEALHEALEANLPTEEPPYDPTAELEEINQTLAGIDSDNTGEVDQPQPGENLEEDSTINDLMTMMQDQQSKDPDDQGVLNL